MKERNSFPIRVEKNRVTVPVYRVRSGKGYSSYVISYRENGARRKKGFATINEATKAAKRAAGHIASGHVEAIKVRPEDAQAYIRAAAVLKPFRIRVDAAASEYAAAVKVLGKTVSIAARIHDFLLLLDLAPRTVNNFRTSISNLITFARMKRYIPADSDLLRDVPEVKEPHREVGIYTPREVESLIEKASPKFLPYLVIGAFAGLRQSELERLDWADVGEKYIRIRGAERRTKSTRLVEIQPNLQGWLKTLRQPRGRVVPFANVWNPLTRLVKQAEVTQKHNGLRHSFGSYRLAIVQDAAKVSFEMGNSPKMVFEHYREIVTPEQAQRWFGIKPENETEGSGSSPHAPVARDSASEREKRNLPAGGH